MTAHSKLRACGWDFGELSPFVLVRSVVLALGVGLTGCGAGTGAPDGAGGGDGAGSPGVVGAGQSGSLAGQMGLPGAGSGNLPTGGVGNVPGGGAGSPAPGAGASNMPLGGAGNATGGTGAGGAAGAGGGSNEPAAGVVVVDGTSMVRSCVALCAVQLDPAADPEGDDWGYENGASCVIPGTVTGNNQPCTTGQPVPAPAARAGVVVVDAGAAKCAPLCTIITNVANDPDGDGWSFEDNQSCVIPGTVTASNQMCTTGSPIPAPEPRPGVLINIDTDPDAECVAVCRVTTTPSDATAPDWGYEDNASCVLPGSPSATGKMECTFNGEPRSFKPPALTGAKLRPGFYIEDGKLYDAYGGAFVIRGVNNAHIYFDTSARYLAWQALDNIASYGTNTIRVVWTTEGTAALLAEVLYRIVELKMVPMVELHDVTGSQDSARLLDMAEYYTRADVLQVLNDFREYLLVNIANEWSGEGNYASGYQAAISHLRSAGVAHTLVIDGSGYGQDANSIFSNAAALTNADPDRNLLFSLHMYGQYPNAAAVDAAFDRAQMSMVPLIVGEFGHQLQGTNVAWQHILDRCQALGIGYIPWSWMGNDAVNAHLDMAEDWEGPLTSWGRNVLTGANGIQSTSRRATIFN